jgi:hypothetical protein
MKNQILVAKNIVDSILYLTVFNTDLEKLERFAFINPKGIALGEFKVNITSFIQTPSSFYKKVRSIPKPAPVLTELSDDIPFDDSPSMT